MNSKTGKTRKPFSRRRYVKRGPWRYILVGVILAAVAAYHLVPMAISSANPSEKITQSFTDWLGAPARIVGDAEISFWPRPAITVTGISVPQPSGPGPLIYGNASRMTADLSLPALLTGDISFSDIVLDGAVIILEMPEDEDGRPAGALARAVADAETGSDALSALKGPEELKLVNATIGLTRAGKTSIVKGVNGTFEWPKLAGTARFSGSSLIDGENTKFSFKADHAADLIAGKTSNIDLSVSKDTSNVRYTGTATTKHPYLLDGQISLSTSHLKELMAWAGVESRLLRNVETAAFEGTLSRSGGSLRFSPARVTIEKAKGNGVVDLMPAGGANPLSLSGTMAFDEISLFDAKSSLPAWIDAVAAYSKPSDEGMPPIPELDLRLSAGTVNLSDMTLNDVAASIIRSPQQTSFDIADSRLGNGSLFAHVGVRHDGGANVQITAENVPAGPFFSQLGFDVPLKTDALSIDMVVDAPLPLSALNSDGVTGSIRFSTGPGTLSWMAFGKLIEQAKTKDNFTFSPLQKSPHTFKSLSGHAELSGTKLTLEDVTMETESDTITFEGTVDTISSRLRATLTVTPKADNGEAVTVEIEGNALAAIARKIDNPQSSAE